MKKYGTALALIAALCIGVFGTADAQSNRYRLVTKRVQFGTWGPTGIVAGSLQDTSQTIFSGANDVDTTAAIDISNYAWELLGTSSGAASVVQAGLKVWIVSDGGMDAVDSIYYAIEHSPDGSHWVRQNGLIAAGSVAWKGVQAGQDQDGDIAVTANNAVSFQVVVDADNINGTSATQVAGLGEWYLAPFVRLHILTDDTAGNLIGAARVYVSYVAHEP